jgi:hypothetical protein
MSVQCRGSIALDAVVIVVVIAVVVAGADSETSNAVFSGDAAPRRSKSKEISSPLLSELGSEYLMYTRVRTVRLFACTSTRMRRATGVAGFRQSDDNDRNVARRQPVARRKNTKSDAEHREGVSLMHQPARKRTRHVPFGVTGPLHPL